LIFGPDGIDAHQRGFMCFGAICPNWWASNEIGANTVVFDFIMNTLGLSESAK
jgi:hypothetical protein